MLLYSRMDEGKYKKEADRDCDDGNKVYGGRKIWEK